MLDFILNFLIHGLTQASWVAKLVYFFIVTQLTIFAVTLYLHRSQAHRGVDFHPVLAHFFRFWSWLSTGMLTQQEVPLQGSYPLSFSPCKGRNWFAEVTPKPVVHNA